MAAVKAEHFYWLGVVNVVFVESCITMILMLTVWMKGTFDSTDRDMFH